MKNRWNIAKARASFSELLLRAADEPQEIVNRGKLVAIVVDPAQFMNTGHSYAMPFADVWASLDKAKGSEKDDGLTLPAKQPARDPFEGSKESDNVSRRHKRHLGTNKKRTSSKGRGVA